MEKKSSAEYKTLYALKKRFKLIIELLSEYKTEPKALDKCMALIKSEGERMSAETFALSVDEIRDIGWRYGELGKIAKRLKKGNDVDEYNRACADLKAVDEKTTAELAELKLHIGATAATAAMSDFAEKLKDGADKVTDAVGGAFRTVKKTVTGDLFE